MFVRNAWYMAAWADEVSTKPLARRICDLPIVLFRSLEGEACALIDSCSHRGAPLSLGTVVPGGIRCNYHGVVFGCTGRCLNVPNQTTIPEKAKVESFVVVERDEILWIWIGEAELADPALIVDYPFHSSPKWPHRHTMTPVASNYLLIADNLLDGTHLAYVHGDTVGGADPDVHMRAESSLKPATNGIRFERLMRNAPPPPAYAACVAFEGNIDRWQEFDFVAPSTVLQYSGGVMQGVDRYASNNSPRFDMRIFHTATPATANSCYYFYSVANGHQVEDPSATDLIFNQVAAAIVEDKLFIEAQQKMVDELGEDRLFDNAADAARIMARRSIKIYEKTHP